MSEPTAITTPLTDAIRNGKRGFLQAAVFSAFLNMLMLATPIYMLQVFDRVLTTGNTDTLLALTAIVLLALTALGSLEAVRLLLLSRTASWIHASLGSNVVLASSAAALVGRTRGTQPLQDVGSLRSYIGSANLTPLFDTPWTPIFVLFIFLLHPWLGVLAILSALALIVVAVLNDKTSRPATAAGNSLQQVATTHADEAVHNAEVVHAMGMGDRVVDRWTAQTSLASEKLDDATKWVALFLGISRVLRFGAQAGVLGCGAALVIRGDLTPGGMIAGSILLGRALAPVDQSIGAWRAFVGAREAHSRLSNLFKSSPVAPDGMSLPNPIGNLTIEGVTFLHPMAEKPVLDGVNFNAPPGTITAIIGPSASGKSSLCRTLVGAWRPTSGHVRLDGADIADWPRAEVGNQIGYLPQDVELFSGSIKDNISRMTNCTPEAVIAAAESAGIHQTILRLPRAYDTPIGPQGAKLSGGQRQRIGLARALFGQPQLVVLDEPNANLDTAGEVALSRALLQARDRGATILIATHKRQLLSIANNIVMLDHGRTRAFGPKDQVFAELEQGGVIRASAPKHVVESQPNNVTPLTHGASA